MKNLLKVTVFLLSLAMLATSLAGCAPKSPGTAELDFEGTEVIYNGDKIYPVQCEDSLEFFVGLPSAVSVAYENFGDTPVAKAIKERTGVNIIYVHPSSPEQFQLMLAGNELTDIVKDGWVDSVSGGPQYAIDEGYIYRLNEILDMFSPNLKKVLEENEVYDKQAKTDRGDYYVYPFFYGGEKLRVASGPILRKDLLDKVGLAVPETVDEWETVLTAFKEKFDATAPMAGAFASMANCIAPAFNVWTGWHRNGDTVVYGPYEEGYKDLLAKLHDWYKKGLIDPDFATSDSKKVNADMLNGRSGAVYGWAGSGMGQWLKSATIEGFDLVGAKYAAPQKGATPEYGVMGGHLLVNCGAAITKQCKNVELAARFLDYGYSEEGHILYNFGIEGESFEWVDKDGEKYPQYTDYVMNNETYTASQMLAFYNFASYNGLMVQDERYIEQYYPTTQQKEAQEIWAQTNMDNHLLPQIYLKEEETEEDSNIMANITTYVEEMTAKFITGAESLDNYDKYLAQLREFGVEKAIKFRQDAYNRYLKR